MNFLTKKIALIFFLILINSCQSAFIEILYASRFSLIGYADEEITQEYYDNFPFSFITIKPKGGPQAILVLNSITNGVYEWISADGEKIFTYKGIIIKTEYLEHNLQINNYNLINLKSSEEIALKFNFDKPVLYEGKMALTFSKDEIIESDHLLYLNQEVNKRKATFRSKQIGFNFNGYLIMDQNYRVITAEQRVHPNLKPYRVNYYYKK